MNKKSIEQIVIDKARAAGFELASGVYNNINTPVFYNFKSRLMFSYPTKSGGYRRLKPPQWVLRLNTVITDDSWGYFKSRMESLIEEILLDGYILQQYIVGRSSVTETWVFFHNKEHEYYPTFLEDIPSDVIDIRKRDFDG